MKKIGVIGAGVMGIGIAQCIVAQSSLYVVLIDINQAKIEKAKQNIYRNLKLQALQYQKPYDVPTLMDKINFTTDYDYLKEVDFVIESATEDWDVKQTIFKQIDQLCGNQCVFATNTSCLSITQIASLTVRPDKVIGIHFINPVEMKPVVEMIKGYHTSDDTIQIAESFLEYLGKSSVLINDYPGFVTNRLSHLFMNEAAFIVQDGVAEPEKIDDIFKKCYGHKMGPLETADLIGIDTVVNSLNILYQSYQDPKFRCCPLLKKMVYAGLLGVKTKEGFYKY